MHAVACRGQKRVLNPLELKSQAAISHLTWVLGTYVLWKGSKFSQPPSVSYVYFKIIPALNQLALFFFLG